MEKFLQVFKNLIIFVQKLNKVSPTFNYIDFGEFFRSEGMLNFFGLSNLPRDTPISRSRERRALFKLSMIISLVFLGLNVTSFMYGLIHGGSLLVLTENVGCICIEMLILIKGLMIMYWRREKFVDIVFKLKQHFPDSAWDQHVFHVSQHLKTLKTCVTICASLYRAVMVQFTSMPVFIKLYGLIFSQETQWELIIQILLPLDTSAPIVYSLLSIINTWSFIVGTFTVLMTDLLFVELVAVINVELEALAQLISEIDPADGQDEAIDELKKLSENHQQLIDISEELKDIFSPILFIDCFSMMITMCCTAFLSLVIYLIFFEFFMMSIIFVFCLQSGLSTYFLLKYFLITVVGMWNAFIHCFYGDRLNE